MCVPTMMDSQIAKEQELPQPATGFVEEKGSLKFLQSIGRGVCVGGGEWWNLPNT